MAGGRKYSNAGRRNPKRCKEDQNYDVDYINYSWTWRYWKSSNSVRLFFLFIICGGAFFTVMEESPFSDEQHRYTIERPRVSDDGWPLSALMEKEEEMSGGESEAAGSSSPGYISYQDVDWAQLTKTISEIDFTRIGLLNFDGRREIDYWRKLVLPAGVNSSVIDLEHVKSSLKWATLYPEWINEEGTDHESEQPICPSLPDVPADAGNPSRYDLIAVKLPCNKSGEWSRDVARLHLQLSAAKLAAAAASGGRTSLHVLFVTECFPIPNLFRLKDLVFREGNIWLYKPDIRSLNQNIQLPIGSCKLAVPLTTREGGGGGRPETMKVQREAYVTILHSANFYVCGAIAAARSLRMTGSTRDLVILVDKKISDHRKKGLESAGWKVRVIERIRNPKAERDAYNRWNYSKFRLWELTDYDKIIFIDADLIILRNIDFLFAWPEITATGNDGTLFNSGVMVIEPSNTTFNLLMDHIHVIQSYNGGDQGYLNEVFTWWHRMPRTMNFLKHFWEGDGDAIREQKTQLFAADPPVLYVLHYLGMKPWWCYRDYDCNWNVDTMQEFASDVAHRRWWDVHDSLPEKLRSFCLLRSKQKALLEWDRIHAEKSNFSDGHWKRKIGDKRLKICNENPCYRKSMLSFWVDQNRTL